MRENMKLNELYSKVNYDLLTNQINYHVSKQLKQFSQSLNHFIKANVFQLQNIKLTFNNNNEKIKNEIDISNVENETDLQQLQQNNINQDNLFKCHFEKAFQEIPAQKKDFKYENIINLNNEVLQIESLGESIIAILENGASTIQFYDIFKLENQLLGVFQAQGTIVTFKTFECEKIKQQKLIFCATYQIVTLFDWKKGSVIMEFRPNQKILKDIEPISQNEIVVGGSNLVLKFFKFKLFETFDCGNQIQQSNQDQQSQSEFEFKIQYRMVGKPKAQYELKGHIQGINMIKKIDKQILVTDDGPRPFQNRTLIWNYRNKQLIRIFMHPGKLSSITRISKSQILLSYSNTLRYISLSTGKPDIKIDVDFVSHIQKIGEKQLLVAGGGSFYQQNEGSLIILNVLEEVILKAYERQFEGHVQAISSINSDHIITANFNLKDKSVIKLWSPFL